MGPGDILPNLDAGRSQKERGGKIIHASSHSHPSLLTLSKSLTTNGEEGGGMSDCASSVRGAHTHEREETERRANGLESGENGLSPLLFTLRSENTQLSSSLDPSPPVVKQGVYDSLDVGRAKFSLFSISILPSLPLFDRPLGRRRLLAATHSNHAVISYTPTLLSPPFGR